MAFRSATELTDTYISRILDKYPSNGLQFSKDSLKQQIDDAYEQLNDKDTNFNPTILTAVATLHMAVYWKTMIDVIEKNNGLNNLSDIISTVEDAVHKEINEASKLIHRDQRSA
jgi:ABC-type transporter lipoprotein component MlaA